MKAEQNELITRVGPGTPCGDLLRRYWQPVALVDEFNPALDPRMAQRPVKAVRLFLTWARETSLLDVDDLLQQYPVRTGSDKRWMSRLDDGTLLSLKPYG